MQDWRESWVLDPGIVLFDEPDSGLDPVRTAFLNELIIQLNRQLEATFMVVTHDISTAKRVSDYIGMLYRRNLVQFGPAHEMFESDIPVVRQFLAGDTEGGMSEEKDQTKSAEQDAKDMGRDTDEDTSDDTRPRSGSGMTARRWRTWSAPRALRKRNLRGRDPSHPLGPHRHGSKRGMSSAEPDQQPTSTKVVTPLLSAALVAASSSPGSR